MSLLKLSPLILAIAGAPLAVQAANPFLPGSFALLRVPSPFPIPAVHG